jgi:tRNA modification GTPase
MDLAAEELRCLSSSLPPSLLSATHSLHLSRLAMREVGRITGTVEVEDLLDIIFRDFCIGK